jgi:hypothetical protein
LNDWTIKSSYLLPLISKILDKLRGTKYFTKLDVCWGYKSGKETNEKLLSRQTRDVSNQW